jgi:hypothetical protein
MPTSNKKGLGLLEVIVAISMIVLFFAVITAVTYSLRAFQENQFKISASYILQASIDEIRSLPFASLVQRTNAPLTGITFNFGSWETAQDANAPSLPNVLRLLKPHSPPPGGGDVKAMIAAPSSNVENGDFEAEIKLNSSSPNSFAGLFFRSQDNFSYYRFIFNESQIKFEKVANGTPSVLWQQSRSFATSSFYKLGVSFASSNINLFLDDLELSVASDASFAKGDLGILVVGDLAPSIDDVTVTSGLSYNWNFDSATPPNLPVTWRRYSLYDLPGGQGFLTVEDVASDIKKITVRLNWTTNFGQKSLETQTYITSY